MDEQVDPEESFEQQVLHLEPGQLDLRVFDQDKVWVDVHARVHHLSEMSTAYLLNVQLHIIECAVSFRFGIARRDLIDAVWDTLRGRMPVIPRWSGDSAEAEQWARRTVLFRAITAIVDARHDQT